MYQSGKEFDQYLRGSFHLDIHHPLQLIRSVYPDMEASIFDMHYVLELGVIRQGKMDRHYPDYNIELEPCDIWLTNTWEPHGFYIKEAPCEAFVFIVSPEFLAQKDYPGFNWLEVFTLPSRNRPYRLNQDKKTEVLRIIEKIVAVESYSEKLKQRWLELLFFELLLLLYEHTPVLKFGSHDTETYDFQRIQAAVNMVFSGKKYISLEDAARLCYMSRNTFAKIFFKTMGVGFATFSLHHRLSNVARELKDAHRSIKEISLEWGFSDHSHLNKSFKAVYGLSPKEFRKRNE